MSLKGTMTEQTSEAAMTAELRRQAVLCEAEADKLRQLADRIESPDPGETVSVYWAGGVSWRISFTKEFTEETYEPIRPLPHG